MKNKIKPTVPPKIGWQHIPNPNLDSKSLQALKSKRLKLQSAIQALDGKIKGQEGQEDNFERGILVYAVARKYKGVGKIVLILHQAEPNRGGFCYGLGRIWTAPLKTVTERPRKPAR